MPEGPAQPFEAAAQKMRAAIAARNKLDADIARWSSTLAHDWRLYISGLVAQANQTFREFNFRFTDVHTNGKEKLETALYVDSFGPQFGNGALIQNPRINFSLLERGEVRFDCNSLIPAPQLFLEDAASKAKVVTLLADYATTVVCNANA